MDAYTGRPDLAREARAMSVLPWTAQAVLPEQRQALYDQAHSFDTEMSRSRNAIRIGGYIVGAVGAVVGVCGMVAAATLFPIKQTVVEFVPWNTEVGLVGEAVLAKDAPTKLFRDQQADADLLKFVTAAETWVSDVADINNHTVAVMSARDQQAVFAARMSAKNPASPQIIYGNKATVRVEHFRFSRLGRVPDGAQVWQVRFDRTEVLGGAMGPTRPWLATVTFAWHPDILGSEADRAINLTGFQCTAYEAGPA